MDGSRSRFAPESNSSGLKVEPQSDFDLPRIAGAIGAAEERGGHHTAETVELLVIQQILHIDDERHGRLALTG